jgi:hypothetical protein
MQTHFDVKDNGAPIRVADGGIGGVGNFGRILGGALVCGAGIGVCTTTQPVNNVARSGIKNSFIRARRYGGGLLNFQQENGIITFCA